MNPTIEDLLMAYRYAYYVCAKQVISDYLYDQLEKVALTILPESSPMHRPGSDVEGHYTGNQIVIARQLMGKS